MWQQEGLLCGENDDVLFITSGFDEETGSSGEVPGSVLEVKQGSALQVFRKNSLSAGSGLPLSTTNFGVA